MNGEDGAFVQDMEHDDETKMLSGHEEIGEAGDGDVYEI
jgi:hypothetical protein